MSRTTIVMEDSLQEEAKELGVNVSEVCRESVAAAIEAIREAKKFGDAFTTVQAEREIDRYDSREKVEFVGRLVARDEIFDLDFYVTGGGRPAVIDEDGLLHVAENLDDLGLEGWAHQAMAEALGEVVRPTFLDI